MMTKSEETMNEELKEDLGEEMKEEEAAGEESQEEAGETAEETAENSGDETADQTGSSEEDEELQIKYLRLMADFQNFKKRAERDKSDIYARSNEKIVTELLNVSDNFERALAEDSASADENFLKGMQLIFDQFMSVLAKFGVVEIEAEGCVFDPNFHNAVMMEDTDKVESGMVSEVLQKGYTLNGKVIRPTMVKVAN